MDHLRFPIGRFEPVPHPTFEQRTGCIDEIRELVPTLRNVLDGLHSGQLHTPYRPQGWSVQQVVHHLADNDMNAYLRFKRGITEDNPLISTYREDLWAELDDYKDVPPETSLLLLEALHSRFVILLRSLNPSDFSKTMTTQLLGSITLDTALQRFVWHHRHHAAQITSLKDRMGW